nr:hypothetical protein [Hornefia butyriciproducens]
MLQAFVAPFNQVCRIDAFPDCFQKFEELRLTLFCPLENTSEPWISLLVLAQKACELLFGILRIIGTVHRFQISEDLFPVLLTDVAGNGAAQVDPALLVLGLRKLVLYGIPHVL